MVPDPPFSRVLLYGLGAATVGTGIAPMFFSESLKHPCRKAQHGWRHDCRTGKDRGGVIDWVATSLQLVGFVLGGFLARLSSQQNATARGRAVADALRSGFLGGLMSFSYVVQHAAHISVSTGSLFQGFGYVSAVVAAGLLLWRFGWWICGTLDGRSSGSGAGEETPAKPLLLRGGSLALSLQETTGVLGFALVTYTLRRQGSALADAGRAPDFVSYELLDLDLGPELALTAAFTVLGLVSSSMVPWHRHSLGPALSRTFAQNPNTTLASSTSPSHRWVEDLVSDAVGTLLANTAAFALVVLAFAAASRWPVLLDSPLFAGFLSTFCGCVSNLEGVAGTAWAFVVAPQSLRRDANEAWACFALTVAMNLVSAKV